MDITEQIRYQISMIPFKNKLDAEYVKHCADMDFNAANTAQDNAAAARTWILETFRRAVAIYESEA